MKKHLIFPLILVVMGGIACGGDGARRGNQNASYETVQEGSAAGVTSTIQGPGEGMPPITGTNADTTTAFSINPNAVATTTSVPPPNAAGTMAGTFPPSTMTQSAPYPRTAIPPMTSAAPARTVPVQPPPRRIEPVEPEEPTPATDTAMTSTTGTTSTTATQPPPVTQTNPPEHEDDDQEEEPPPPTTTDTRGGQ